MGVDKYARYRLTDKCKRAQRKYRVSDKGKLCDSRYKSKRRRKLNSFAMFKNPFDMAEKINWHHITDAYVVAIPEDLHLLYNGKYHRDKVMEIVKQIYLKDGD